MENLTYGDLTIIGISLVKLMDGVNENSELGKQMLEAICKVDLMMVAIRADLDKKKS